MSNNLTCTKCNTVKPLNQFTKANKTTRGYAYHCKSCIRDYNIRRREATHKTWEHNYYGCGKAKAYARRKYEYFKTNVQARTAHSLRTELNHALRQHQPNRTYSRIFNLIGLKNREELIAHLNSTAPANLTFERNYGLGRRLSVDHIRPLSSFDLTDETERKKAFHHSNLRLITFKENQQKGSKILA